MKAFRDEWKFIKDYYLSSEHQKEIEDSKKVLKQKQFVLYGAGIEGNEFANVLRYGGCMPVCFCDKYKSGSDPNFGLDIISPECLLHEYKDTNIVISSSLYKDEIEKDLKDIGVSTDRILPRKLLLLLLLNLCSEGQATFGRYLKRSHYLMLFNSLKDMVANENGKQFLGVEQTYNWLSDDTSKKVLIDYLKLCFIATPVYNSPLEMQYFDPVIALTDKEVYVDCGAYTGDTAQTFIKKVENKYLHYYAFEPDPDNYRKAYEFLKKKHDTTLVSKGLWSHDTSLCFKEGYASCSTMAEEGEVVVDVTSLDTFFKNKNDIPTIIKMDIEGSELRALIGCMEIISKYKPKLEICIYHKPEDLYEIPSFIKTCRPDYKFYIRHYTDTFAELVLYAI